MLFLSLVSLLITIIFTVQVLRSFVKINELLNAAFSFGIITGLLVSLFYGGYYLISHYASRLRLVRSGKIPWKIISFLNFCTDHILLQRAGGGYQFIHPLLKDYFAALDEPAEDSQGRV